MRLTSILDRKASTGTPPTTELLVLWQHPDTREIVPIGRFSNQAGLFVFVYTRAAARVDGFRPLPGLGDIYQRFESRQIPAVFNQRVMESDRPDFAEYMKSIGLDPASATPWEQIVESGGTRAGDTLQFMQLPYVMRGRAHARFLVNGVRHVAEADLSIDGRVIRVSGDEHEAVLSELEVGDSLLIEPEDANPNDPCAALLTSGGVPIGWIPRALSESIRNLLGIDHCDVTVVRVRDRFTPPHLRLVVDLDLPAPRGFHFDPSGSWDTLA